MPRHLLTNEYQKAVLASIGKFSGRKNISCWCFCVLFGNLLCPPNVNTLQLGRIKIPKESRRKMPSHLSASMRLWKIPRQVRMSVPVLPVKLTSCKEEEGEWCNDKILFIDFLGGAACIPNSNVTNISDLRNELSRSKFQVPCVSSSQPVAMACLQNQVCSTTLTYTINYRY